MRDFLKQLQLTDNAISIYLKSIGKPPLTYHELYTLIKDITKKEFDSALMELISTNLLIELIPYFLLFSECFSLALPQRYFGSIIHQFC